MNTQLWWVNPDTFSASPASLLSEQKRQQHQHFIPPKKRHEYLVTRVLVRTVLGQALGWQFECFTRIQGVSTVGYLAQCG
jgi:hypothetical protein